jgi:putative transposase
MYRREATGSTAIAQTDHTPLDIELVQFGVDSAKTAKPWLSVILNNCSRAVAGYFQSFESPSSLNVPSLYGRQFNRLPNGQTLLDGDRSMVGWRTTTQFLANLRRSYGDASGIARLA